MFLEIELRHEVVQLLHNVSPTEDANNWTSQQLCDMFKKIKFDAKQLDHGVFNTTEINNRAMVAVSVDSCLVKIWPVGGILQ